MIKKWYTNFSVWTFSRSETVGSAALLIALAGIVSRILGFFRDRILASQFGAGDVLDAYYAAFRIPDLLYSLLVLGALSAAFVPIFTELITEKKEVEAWRLTSGVLQLLFLVLGGLSFLGIIFASVFVPLITPGFSQEKTDMVILLTRIMLLSPIFLSLSAVLGSVLVSFKQFVAYSLAPILYNVGIIIGAVLLAPFFGPIGLAWGVVIGSLFHVLIQYPSIQKTGFRFVVQPYFFWKDVTIRRVVRLMIPRSLSLAVSQMSLFTMTIFASTLASGSLAVFTLANNIQSVPLGLFGIAFSIAVFPSLAIFFAEKKEKKFFETFSQTSTRILFFVVPISMFMILFRAQFVRVILGAGQFDWEDTILTFETLEILAFSLFAQSLIPLFVRAFFAIQDTKTPFYTALVSAFIQIALIPFLLPTYSLLALAIAFSVSNILNVVILYFFLRTKLAFWNDATFFVPIIKIIFATVGAGIVAQISKSVFALTIDELDTFVKVFFQLGTGLTIGSVSFLIFCHWFKVEELGMVKRFILCKILRQPETATVTEDHPERGDW